MKHHPIVLLCCLLLPIVACESTPTVENTDQATSVEAKVATKAVLEEYVPFMESIEGKAAYLNSPYVCAGKNLYVVGHQNGQFPDLGWHVKGEMGGIWQHPIKLMDGYQMQISDDKGNSVCLNQATAFRNYPIMSAQDFDMASIGLSATQYQAIPDDVSALVVELVVENNQAEDFTGYLDFSGMVDLRPVWLGERTDMLDGQDQADFDEDLKAWVAKDLDNEWYTIWGSSSLPVRAIDFNCQDQPLGQGITKGHRYHLAIPAREQKVIQFYITGSPQSLQEAKENYYAIKDKTEQLIEKKYNRYKTIKETAVLEAQGDVLNQAFLWTKYASDWLHFEVEGIGAGIAAGIPDYPWWFGCDQTYSVRGLIHAGMPEIAKAAMYTLLDLSQKANDNGRIVHEVSTNGAVYNPGNINETPHFISTAWEYFRWTNDVAFLERAYPQTQKALIWLEEQDEDKNGYPDGHGMMEIRGMDAEMMDVIAYTQEAYAAAAKMAAYFEEEEKSEEYQQKATALAEKINAEWWVEDEKSYADFRADLAKAKTLLADALVRADTLGKTWSVADLKLTEQKLETSNQAGLAPYAFYHNWVVNTPLEVGIADRDKALEALETAQKFVNPFGVYVTGIDRKKEENDLEAFAALKAKESFNYTGAVMTLPTGVQAIASCQYGQMDDALDYLERMVRSFSYAAPGSMYEVSPDYGMLVQAWNIYSMAKPIVGFFFGIQPEAHRQLIKIEPQMPSSWQDVSLKNLPVADNSISLSVENRRYTIEQTKDWEIQVVLPAGVEQARLNQKAVPVKDGVLRSKARLIVVEF